MMRTVHAVLALAILALITATLALALAVATPSTVVGVPGYFCQAEHNALGDVETICYPLTHDGN